MVKERNVVCSDQDGTFIRIEIGDSGTAILEAL
jgi:hypothetical protein